METPKKEEGDTVADLLKFENTRVPTTGRAEMNMHTTMEKIKA